MKEQEKQEEEAVDAEQVNYTTNNTVYETWNRRVTGLRSIGGGGGVGGGGSMTKRI